MKPCRHNIAGSDEGWPRRGSRCGFSFIEVLFAVMILGTGFVMLAGVFPVAIDQVASSADITVGAVTGRSAMSILGAVMTSANAPETGSAIVPISSSAALWERIRGNTICSADPRYAWVAAYRRDPGSRLAYLYVIVVRNRNQSVFSAQDVIPGGADAPAPLDLRAVHVRIEEDQDSGTARFSEPNDSSVGAVAPGTYLLLSNPGALGEAAGGVYRVSESLGIRDGDAVWSLMPGNDVPAAGGAPPDPSTALLVGRGYAESGKASGGYAGLTQDVAVYCTIIALH